MKNIPEQDPSLVEARKVPVSMIGASLEKHEADFSSGIHLEGDLRESVINRMSMLQLDEGASTYSGSPTSIDISKSLERIGYSLMSVNADTQLQCFEDRMQKGRVAFDSGAYGTLDREDYIWHKAAAQKYNRIMLAEKRLRDGEEPEADDHPYAEYMASYKAEYTEDTLEDVLIMSRLSGTGLSSLTELSAGIRVHAHYHAIDKLLKANKNLIGLSLVNGAEAEPTPISYTEEEIARHLLESHSTTVYDNIKEFDSIEGAELAEMFLEAGEGIMVVAGAHKFDGVDRSEFIPKLLLDATPENGGTHMASQIGMFLHRYEDLDTRVAHSMMDHFVKFSRMCGGKYDTGLSFTVEDIEELGPEIFTAHDIKIAEEWDEGLRKDVPDWLAQNIESFRPEHHLEIASRIIESGVGIGGVLFNLDKFQGIDQLALAEQIIARSLGKIVGQNINCFDSAVQAKILGLLQDANS